MQNTPHTLTRLAKEQNIDVKTLIKNALNQRNGNVSHAADDLGVSRQGLQYQMVVNRLIRRACIVDEEETKEHQLTQ